MTTSTLTSDTRRFQIDIMKAMAIFTVIGIHGSWGYPVESIFRIENLWQILLPVPLFFVIMGYNYGKSFDRREYESLRDIYTKDYLKRTLIRFLIPVLLLNVLCFFFAAYIYGISGDHLYGFDSTWINPGNHSWTYQIGWPQLLWAPLLTGSGSYFVSMLPQFIVLFPIMYIAYKKNPKFSLMLFLGLELIFQLIAPSITLFDTYPYLFDICILRYLSVISLGLWFTKKGTEFDDNNFFVLVFAPISLLFLYQFFFHDFELQFFRTKFWWGKTNLITYFYPAFLFLLFMNYLPEKKVAYNWISEKLSNFIESVSNYTYHILLFQIPYFFLYHPWSLHSQLFLWFLFPKASLLYLPSKIFVICIDFLICYMGAIFLKKLEKIIMFLMSV